MGKRRHIVRAAPARGPRRWQQLAVVASWLVLGWAAPACALTFVVNDLGDTADANIGNGTCADAGGKCTLRAAIEEANVAATTPTSINFNVGTGTPVIHVGGSSTSTSLTPLPTIIKPVIIGAALNGATRIELEGSSAGDGSNGLTITAGSSTVQALVIDQFSGAGIVLSALGNNVIRNCFIGTDATGNGGSGNSGDGISIVNSPTNTIGGTTTSPVTRNVIGLNGDAGIEIQGSASTGNLVQGNFIGLALNGVDSVGNGVDGVRLTGAPTNTISGTSTVRQVISGNGEVGSGIGNGVLITGSGASANSVFGNFIGTDSTGAKCLDSAQTVSLGNAGDGVQIDGAPNNIIGGPTTAARNLITCNGTGALSVGMGVDITGSGATGNTLQNNYIGVNASEAGILDTDGVTLLSNATFGVGVSDGAANNFIGASGAGNTIAANGDAGVSLSGGTTCNFVQGNRIGTNSANVATVGNQGDGVNLDAAPNNIIGTAPAPLPAGCTAPATACSTPCNVIANNSNGLRMLNGATGVAVLGNYIGVKSTGTAALGNRSDGVLISNASSNTVAGNVISSNDTGVEIEGGTATLNVVRGNLIGTTNSGTSALPNAAFGIRLISSASQNTIGGTTAGSTNTIAFNGREGVFVATGCTGNAIRQNSIFSNTGLNAALGLGIDLAPFGVSPNDVQDPDPGSNNLQNFPFLCTAASVGGNTTITGTFNSTPNTPGYTIEFFSNPANPGCDASGNGEGKTFLGSTTLDTDASGNVGTGAACTGGGIGNFAVTLPVTVTVGDFITATATDPNGNTSEFSGCVAVVLAPTPTRTGTPTRTPTGPTLTPTRTPTATPSNTPTSTPLNTSTPTQTPTGTPTRTPTQTPSSTATQTPTGTPSGTPTQTRTPTQTPTNTPTNTPTATPVNTSTPTRTRTPTGTPSSTPTSTPTQTPTSTPTNTPTATPVNTSTPTRTATGTPSSTPTLTPTQTPTSSPTNTPTATPVNTSTPTRTPTGTPSSTPTSTPTQTPTSTPTNTPTATPVNTSTPTQTPTGTPSSTPTQTPTLTPTQTPTSSPTNTPTATPVNTSTPTRTPTGTPSSTPTSTPTQTPTSTPTNTPTATPVNTPDTATAPDRPTPTQTPTSTPTNTPTRRRNTATPTGPNRDTERHADQYADADADE